MTIKSNSQPNSSPTPEVMPLSPDGLDGISDNGLTAKVTSLPQQQHLAALSQAPLAVTQPAGFGTANTRVSLITLMAIALIFVGLALNNFGSIGIPGS